VGRHIPEEYLKTNEERNLEFLNLAHAYPEDENSTPSKL
jgi:hypothetical protein